ncbi:type II toxin-antitoxin system HicA family toxin [Leptothrix ochracea]|uniref:type II toxin-antitoxin system HicA family toxin n=1 Tax=Leptothrix ochracea TaxID=735331 RepID=UPI0034E20029
MSNKHEKTLRKIVTTPTPSDIKWSDLKGVLEHLGYIEHEGNGSRRKFIHPKTKDIISLHEPHPQPEVKKYVLRQVTDKLRAAGLI